LELTEGDVIDHDRIVAQVLADAETYGVRQVAYDPNWGGDRVAVQLEAGGVEMYAFRQSKRMMTPVLSELDRLLGARLVDHGDNPLLAWCAANLEVLTSSDGLMIPIKPKETGRIDPIVALLMALGSDLRVDDDGDSVYETTEREGGLLTL
ncbi:MAG: terminase TerL endonuclease subunit, partial [Planctomycetota bacterium]